MLAVTPPACAATPPHRAAPRTSVALTFDDGLASQVRAGELLRAHGLRATFYISSGLVGRKGRMTWAQVAELARAGHEIGGHTVSHARLDELTPTEQRAEICEDRRALLARGHDARTLAYPYGAHDAHTARIARECGYRAARGKGGTAFAVPESLTVVNDTTVRAMRDAVLAGERRGGPVILVFHNVCDACGRYAVSPAALDDFLAWLAGRRAHGTVVLPLGRALGV